ncbi:MAG: hypothetical protein ACRD3B_17860 [Candidatus Sulfotelmatobacter sp.]
MEAYIKPTDVHAPRRHWSLIHVLFDGGSADDGNPTPNSLAIGRWDNKPVLAMRWNGNEENPLGNPQSRGLPTWFVVPELYWKQILQTEPYKFSDDKITFALNFLESKCVYFFTHCPNPSCRDYQKLVLCSYRTNDLGETLAKIERNEWNTLHFYHIICDFHWEPSQQDKLALAETLRTAWEDHRLRPHKNGTHLL